LPQDPIKDKSFIHTNTPCIAHLKWTILWSKQMSQNSINHSRIEGGHVYGYLHFRCILSKCVSTVKSSTVAAVEIANSSHSCTTLNGGCALKWPQLL